MSSLKKLLLGFTTGVVIGVLYAPAKGTKTREKLSGAGEKIRDGWNTITDTIAAGLDSVKDHSDDYAAETMHEIEGQQRKNDMPDMIL